MPDNQLSNQQTKDAARPDESQLSGGTYEIIRNRLLTQANDLQARLGKLGAARKDVFGSIDARLLATERVSTENNCVPRDMFSVGDQLLFGYNVHLGLRTETQLKDVFAVYNYSDRTFHQADLSLLDDPRFQADFHNLYRYYKNTTFAQFARVGTYLFMVFQVGKDATDIKTFKWQMGDNGSLSYVDNRSDNEYRFPPQHEFEWTKVTRDEHRPGIHPHISIQDKIFVETVGGDLTIKVEDNTESGSGIYAEPVDNEDQTLDDADISYAIVGNLILLKILPYQERSHRYIVYNEKTGHARRIDSIENACILLPEDHGIIFANGFYLQNGEFKQFENGELQMAFRTRIPSPNGEDTLYVFFDRESGTYVLLSYNMIEQCVDTPIICHGFSLFENGELIYFRTQEELQKHHAIQIWQTPYVGLNFEIPVQGDSYLYKLGNRDIVRCMAACRSILTLVGKEESYANVYVDIARSTAELIDAYFWLDQSKAFNLAQPLEGIRKAASAAIEEFEKVVQLKKDTSEQLASVSSKVKDILSSVHGRRFDIISDFVETLASLRGIRGSIISLRELRYIDLVNVTGLEQQVEEQSLTLSGQCVEFLLGDAALRPYEERVEKLKGLVGKMKKVTEAKELENAVAACGSELEMLIDIVSNLRIEDTTQRTTIIDNISTIYSAVNQVRSRIKATIGDLASAEGEAEFASQLKLLDQGVINYLEVSDTPQKCEEYLTKLSIQIGELEGKFADFDEFVIELTEKRNDIYNAFESRKLKLEEQRNKRTDALLRSANRVLGGMSAKLDRFTTADEINGYFSSDLMVDKVREIINQLRDLDDNVKADDLQAKLKTIAQDSLRQLKDRSELFVEGQDIIKFGPHHFSVNTQTLALTIVGREDGQYLHLTGTNFFETIRDSRIESTKAVWSQQLPSENNTIYRGEFLAHAMLEDRRLGDPEFPNRFAEMELSDLTREVQTFMGPRYLEGYVKGVHDHDGAKLVKALAQIECTVGKLRYSSSARALALYFWHVFKSTGRHESFASKMNGVGALKKMFQRSVEQERYILEIQSLLEEVVGPDQLFEPHLYKEAAEYLFCVLTEGEKWAISPRAAEVYESFRSHLERRGAEATLSGPLKRLDASPRDGFVLISDWVQAFIQDLERDDAKEYHEEIAALMLSGAYDRSSVVEAKVSRTLEGMVGDHKAIEKGHYHLNYNQFMGKLAGYKAETLPLFKAHQDLKKELINQSTLDLRLDEFKPRILSSFVRNKLIDKVYLPLVGDNLAKQIGVVGDKTRTDRMGMLLLISPPGYGKTTLMEYLATRLGLIFMKINGPAIGNRVSSLDPAEAPNAAAREEVKKLNLSLEMGDNVMIYLDDIQHCNPEFLQKFISLCDAQRKIEGVYQGRTRTYDLRGRRVCVVMAGNPYSESGEAFKIPDMLANRADTYNLGDIIGDTADTFKLSYLENSITSNATVSAMASKHFNDVYSVIKSVETGTREGVDFEGSYSPAELTECMSVIEKLTIVRDIILKVNQEYIYSAAQADAYRTEPPFKLQGSYRNMNRIAEKVLPVMNHQELIELVQSHYVREAQTLTTGAESNLLKYKELTGALTQAEDERWQEIKSTFGRNLLLGEGGDDQMAQVITMLSTFSEGLKGIQRSITKGVHSLAADNGHDDSVSQGLKTIDSTLSKGVDAISQSPATDNTAASQEIAQSLKGLENALTRGIMHLATHNLDASNDLRKVMQHLQEAGGSPEHGQAAPPPLPQQASKPKRKRSTKKGTPTPGADARKIIIIDDDE